MNDRPGAGEPIHLDWHTTTPVRAEVREAMEPWWTAQFGAPASVHGLGLQARDSIESARHQVGSLLEVDPGGIIFTGSGTEALNLAVKGVVWGNVRRGRHVVTSAVEHPAVLRSLEWLEQRGECEVTRVGVDSDGRVAVEAVVQAIRADTVLVAVQHANPDVGAVQPVREIGEECRARRVAFLCDASASAGWIPVRVGELGCSLLALAPHRFYGPKGVGVLWVARNVRLQSLIHGGNQENGRRAGVEHVAGIVGCGAACLWATRTLDDRRDAVAQLQRMFWDALQAAVGDAELNGPLLGTNRLPHHISVSLRGVEAEALALGCDLLGLRIGSGPACVTRQAGTAPVFAEMGWPESRARSAMTASFDAEQTPQEIQAAVDIIARIADRIRSMTP